MSGRETVRQFYAALGQGDVPTALGLLSPHVQWREPASLPFGDQVGPEAVAQNVLGAVPGLFDEFALDVTEILDAGEAAVALGAYRARGSRTGRRLDADFAHVWRCDDAGRLAALRVHTDTALWCEVLGERPAEPGASVPARAVDSTSGAAPAR